MSYSIVLPSWSIGPDSYDYVYDIVRYLGSSAAVIGGETALEKAYGSLSDSLKDKNFTITKPICYGKNATFSNIERLENMDEVKNADMIFAVGGGRAIDTCKAVAEHLDKPIFTFPTIASNCAPATSIGVYYNEDDSFRSYLYPKSCPNHTFINTKIIAEAPEELFWAGIGDALSKEYEVELATRGEKLFHTTLLGAQMAHACTKPLIDFAEKSIEQVRAKEPGFELEQVALDIIVTTGIVSNLTCDETKYYYNSSLAHCVYNGATKVLASGGKHLHGEIVSYGVLTLLTYDKQFEERDRIMKFNHSIDLPITLDEIDLRKEDLNTVVEDAHTLVEWTCAPYEFTEEKFIQALIDTDIAGKKLIEANK